MTPEQRIEYAKAVWGTFCNKTGRRHAQMSSLDYHVIATYMDRNVPLRVLLQAIEQSPKVGNGMAYVKSAIDEEIERWGRSTNP